MKIFVLHLLTDGVDMHAYLDPINIIVSDPTIALVERSKVAVVGWLGSPFNKAIVGHINLSPP